MNSKDKLTEKLLAALADYNMLGEEGKGHGVLIALSGGADSVTLLNSMHRLSKKWGFPIVAAHVNHMLRGEESDRDELFCRELCKKESIPLEVLKTDAAKFAEGLGKGVEEAARELRYGFFAEVMKKYPRLDRIATAHTASDNAETVLFNLSRGGGIRGLCGIPPVRDNIIRPLIYASRGDILDYCKSNSLGFVTDSTNTDVTYSRNLIRAEVVPKLSALFGDIAQPVSRTSRILRQDAEYIDIMAEKEYADALTDRGLSTDALADMHPSILFRVLRLAHGKVSKSALEHIHMAELARLVRKKEQPFSLYLPGDIVCRGERGVLNFLHRAEVKPEGEYRIELKEGENMMPDGSVIFLFTENSDQKTAKIQNVYNLFKIKAVSSGTINGILYARPRKNGDSYRFGGMTRKVAKLLSESGMTISEREKLPIICDNSGILWIPGFGVRDGASAKENGDREFCLCYAKNKMAKDMPEDN